VTVSQFPIDWSMNVKSIDIQCRLTLILV